jgi:hypothetical protein
VIVAKLRQVDVLTSQGRPLGDPLDQQLHDARLLGREQVIPVASTPPNFG